MAVVNLLQLPAVSEWRRTKLSNMCMFHKGLISVSPEDKNILWTARAVPNLTDLPVNCTISEIFILITFYLYKLNLGKAEHPF